MSKNNNGQIPMLLTIVNPKNGIQNQSAAQSNKIPKEDAADKRYLQIKNSLKSKGFFK